MKWELRKLTGRFTVLFVILLLILNLILTLIPVASELTPEYRAIREAKETLFNDYKNNREQFNLDVEQYETQKREYDAWLRRVMYADDPGTFTWVNRKIDLPQYGDRQLYEEVLAQINRCETYNDAISEVLFDAYAKLRELGMRRGEFTYEYQVHVILKYEKLQSLQIEAENVKGWDRFFKMKTSTVLLSLAVIGVCSQIFILEKRSRITGILHIAKRGGIPLRLSKTGTVFVLSLCLTVLFTCLPLMVLSFTTGLSDVGKYIQTVDGFLYCPYILTIWQYLLVYIAFRTLLFFLLGLASAVVGQISDSEILTLGVMLLFFGVNALYSRSSSEILRLYNFFDATFGNNLFGRYRAVNLCGRYMGALLFVLLIASGCVVLLVVAAMTAKAHLSSHRLDSHMRDLLSKIRPSRSKRTIPVRNPSVYAFEGYKLLFNQKRLAILLALIVLRCVIASSAFMPVMTLSEGIWTRYIADIASLGGMVNEKTDEYIRAEGKYFSDVRETYAAVKEAHQNGEASEEELREARTKRNYADTVEPIYTFRLVERQQYLKNAMEEYPTLAHPLQYVNDTGVMKFLSPSLDVVYLAFLLFFMPSVFANERQSGFAAIQRIAKRGRCETFRAKLVLSLSVAAAVSILFAGMDCLLLFTRFDVNFLDAGIMSIPIYRNLGWDMSIGTYMVLYRLAEVVGCVLLSIFAVSLSALSETIYKSALLFACVLVLPYLLVTFGTDYLRFLSVSSILHPTVLPDCFVSYLLYAAFAAALLVMSQRKWER